MVNTHNQIFNKINTLKTKTTLTPAPPHIAPPFLLSIPPLFASISNCRPAETLSLPAYQEKQILLRVGFEIICPIN
jgi:hypothetical protein